MPVYEYKALDRKGKNLTGMVDADSESAARTKLRSQGKYPVELNVSAAVSTKTKRSSALSSDLFQRVSSSEIHVVTRQLGTLLGAGIPLITSLDAIIEQTRNQVLKRSFAQIKEAVNEGNTLTNALSMHPRLFSSIYINMVRAGEASGSLDVVLERLADFGEKQQQLKGKLKAALIYPLFMACVGIAILFILITYVIPNITQVFADMERVLPLPTRILIGLSNFLVNYWWTILLLFLVLSLAVWSSLKTRKGQIVRDYLKLKVPIVGPVSQKIMLARFGSTLGSLLASGVELLTSIKIVKAILNNLIIGEVLDEASENISKGRSMTISLTESEWFPPMFVQMIAIGEQSGRLEQMLEKVANAYEQDAETSILTMTSLIEPLMITCMGIAVFFVVLSILLPIFEMNQLVG